MYLSANPSEANQFDPQPPLAGSSSTHSSSSAASSAPTTSSSSVPSPTATSCAAAASTTAASKDEHNSTPVGAIAGGAVGGFALPRAIILTVWRVKYHSKRSSKRHSEMSGLHDSPARDQNGAQNSNGQEKWMMAGVVPMHSPYQDLPSTVPPYSPQHSSQVWSPQMHQGYSQHPPFQEVENRSALRAYSPQASSYSPYRPPSQSSASTSHPSNQTNSDLWGTSSVLNSSQSQYDSSQFARVHQGPPQEMSGSADQSWTGLGVHHVGGNNLVRPELSGG